MFISVIVAIDIDWKSMILNNSSVYFLGKVNNDAFQCARHLDLWVKDLGSRHFHKEKCVNRLTLMFIFFRSHSIFILNEELCISFPSPLSIFLADLLFPCVFFAHNSKCGKKNVFPTR